MADESTFTYDLATANGQVRLLLNDVDQTTMVFTDAEITAFLSLEGDVVKLAAAQAIDTNATDQALTSKVLRTQYVTTDGAKLADAMRKHADALRAQHAASVDDDGGYFEVVHTPTARKRGPELTSWPYF